jgi:V8-like Glu-specific endopeptidase
MVNFANLDLALLKTATGPDFPPALTLASTAGDVTPGADIYTVGYPTKPRSGSADTLAMLFANTFGFKRWSPGRVMTSPGTHVQDTRSWVFNHDATTLGGNSGSCVIAFSGSGIVCVGLHFSGLTGAANHAHVIAEIRNQLAIR